MANDANRAERVFKTAWFSKAAKKSHIADAELCSAIRQVMLGQADDLGGGVFKKRLSKNQYRSIILAKGGRSWIYQFLFAKQDQSNITQEELDEFRAIAKVYAAINAEDLDRLLKTKQWMEICHDQEA